MCSRCTTGSRDWVRNHIEGLGKICDASGRRWWSLKELLLWHFSNLLWAQPKWVFLFVMSPSVGGGEKLHAAKSARQIFYADMQCFDVAPKIVTIFRLVVALAAHPAPVGNLEHVRFNFFWNTTERKRECESLFFGQIVFFGHLSDFLRRQLKPMHSLFMTLPVVLSSKHLFTKYAWKILHLETHSLNVAVHITLLSATVNSLEASISMPWNSLQVARLSLTDTREDNHNNHFSSIICSIFFTHFQRRKCIFYTLLWQIPMQLGIFSNRNHQKRKKKLFDVETKYFTPDPQTLLQPTLRFRSERASGGACSRNDAFGCTLWQTSCCRACTAHL